jgi:hypothetical protein
MGQRRKNYSNPERRLVANVATLADGVLRIYYFKMYL